MDWLRDKKNQPIVAAIAAVVIVGALVFLWLTVFRGPSSDTSTDVSATGGAPMDQGMPTGGGPPASQGTMPTPPVDAAQPSPASGGAQTGSAKPMMTYRGDPFLPVGYKPPPIEKPTPPITDLPIFHFPPPPKPVKLELQPEPPQPVRRLAGVMLNGRVYAIIESSGNPRAQIVQPGEPLEDGLAIVERIEADKVILKTTGPVPRYLTVRLASSARRPTSEPSVTVSPGGGPGPGSAPPPFTAPRRPGGLRRGTTGGS